MIVGMTGCGKTYYLLNMLARDYMRHFDYIFFICPTYFWNHTYQNWEYKDSAKFYPIPCDQNSVDDFLKYIVNNFKGTNSLIILDDCAASQTVKNRVSELVKLAFSARHYGLSTIVITQQMTTVVSRNHTGRIYPSWCPSTTRVRETCKPSRMSSSTSRRRKAQVSLRD